MSRLLLAAALLVLTACAARPLPTQSWDQENLKRNDHGCPTAIFIAPPPRRELEQCP